MPIIGIITKKSKSENGHKTDVLYDDVVRAISNNGGIPIGIVLNYDYKRVIDICDGLIFQGGDNFEDYQFEALKYVYDIDKPVLGICLGMQLMGMLFNGTMIDVDNHKKNLDYAHSISIKRNSKLYNILKCDMIKVNSRHKSIIKNTSLEISAISQDNYIEALEDKTKKFFIGVQWHPESMIGYDQRQNNIFKYFIKCCLNGNE